MKATNFHVKQVLENIDEKMCFFSKLKNKIPI